MITRHGRSAGVLALVGDDEGFGVVLCSLDLSSGHAALVVPVSASEVAPASSCSSSTPELDRFTNANN